jgi:hypothetical protein
MAVLDYKMTQTRWDFSKSRSNYHFDPTINEDANPPFRIVGHVRGDLVYHLQEALKENPVRSNGFKNRLQIQTGSDEKPFTYDMDLAELDYLGLDQDHAFFHNLKPATDILEKLRRHFGFRKKNFGGGFHIQKPGMMFPYHVDEILNVRDNQIDHECDQHPEQVARLEIMVHDWQPGHVWAYGNTYWKQWKAGDIAWHDWRSIPHGTANFGRSDRVTLQVTGLTTESTLDILKKKSIIFI